MASTNQSPQYQKAEAKFLSAQTNEERLIYLEEMIKECPRHKSSEKMLAQLKQRYRRLKEQIEKAKKSGKRSGKLGIKKQDMQAVIIGKTNTGKSSLINILTKASPEISYTEQARFTTKFSVVGIMNFSGVQIQLVEIPAIESEYYDKGLVNTADVVLILITDLQQLKEIEKEINTLGKKMIVFNKIDLFSENEKRKISSTLQSKKYNFVLISTKTHEGIETLKVKIFQSFNKIRVYLKEPGKELDKEKSKPVILPISSNVKDVAEKILKGFSSKVKETKIWGPSSKFSGQVVGLSHKLKDLDIVEFKTK